MSDDFVQAAEQHRMAGDTASAVRVAREGLASEPDSTRGRIALALALLDEGDLAAAHSALTDALVGDAPPRAPEPMIESGFDGVDDDELESAFADAETQEDEMMSANKVVEATLRHEQLDAPEIAFDPAESPTYATASMAELLESQGRGEEASAIRESMEPPEPAAEAPAGDHDRVVETLSSWLENVRRSVPPSANGPMVGGLS